MTRNNKTFQKIKKNRNFTSGDFIVNFQHTSDIVLVLLSLTLNK